MGVYDEYGPQGIQLKVGPRKLHRYAVGDDAPIPDGVYVGYEGIVVVIGEKVSAVFDCLTDKWGGTIEPKTAIAPFNPIAVIPAWIGPEVID